jgi:hypothetical protein
MLAGMHFMDSYNYDVERVKRCVIHYAAPNGKIYPFCAYNSGPVYRERIEREFSIPFESFSVSIALTTTRFASRAYFLGSIVGRALIISMRLSRIPCASEWRERTTRAAGS